MKAFGFITLALLLATPAMAQSRGGSGQTNVGQQNASQAAAMHGNRDMDRFRLESDAERIAREADERENAEAQYGTERLALAERIQALVDAGRCREAREAATQAGERSMALRVRQTCRNRS